MEDVVIVSAARTPVGSFNGALSSLPGHELGAVAIGAALERAGVAPGEVDEVILGQVLQAGAGQGPARQASVKAGVRIEAPAWSLNQICGSGLRSVALAYQQIAMGEAAAQIPDGQIDAPAQHPGAGGQDPHPPKAAAPVQGRGSIVVGLTQTKAREARDCRGGSWHRIHSDR